MNFGMVFNLLTFLFIIFALVFEKAKKNKKTENFFNFIILLAISIILFAMAMPSSFHGFTSTNKIITKCYNDQKQLVSAIENYNLDNTTTVPLNYNSNEIEKYQKEILVKNNYLPKPVYPSRYCTYIIKDSKVFCVAHGSYSSDSPYYTDGSAVKEYEKQDDQKEKSSNYKELKNKEMERTLNIITGIAGLIAALKYFIFIFL